MQGCSCGRREACRAPALAGGEGNGSTEAPMHLPAAKGASVMPEAVLLGHRL